MNTPMGRPKDDDVPMGDDSEVVLTKSGTNGHGAGNGNGNGADHQEPLPETLDQRALKGILEALLFVSHEPLSVDRLVTVLGRVSKAEVVEALRCLREDYNQEGRSLQLVEVAGGFRIVTRPDVAPWVKRLDKVKAAPKLSRSALESLAIVAYKQPIVRAEVEEIRGVETSSVLRTLLERKLVRMMGRKDVPGRPILYGTTKYFLEHFGLRDLSELPPLREFKELGESVQVSLPIDEESLFLTPEPAERV